MSAFHQLLVLGNGFDLECGLASTFADFELPRLGSLEHAGGNPGLPEQEGQGQSQATPSGQDDVTFYLDARGITVWDLILREYRKERSWFDVESTMGDWLEPSSPHLGPLFQAAQECSTAKEGARAVVNLDRTRNLSEFLSLDIDEQVAIMLVDIDGWDGKSRPALFDCLMDQTHRFEQEFTRYLMDQVKSNNRYLKKCRRLITNLVNDRLPDPDSLRPWEDKPEKIEYDENGKQFKGHPEDVSILDFNYTSPLAGLRDCPSITNIHGNLLDRNIIFGIDGSDLRATDPDYTDTVKFTKTFRLMALRQNNNTTIIHPHIDGQPGEETAIIKFYGHSLGPADYSYFQSLFDTVDLYASQTRLIFYYNELQGGNSDPERGHMIAEEMYEKVNQLMTRYGETLDNENHGRNLLHKLLLEGRLSVAPSPR